VNESLYTRWTSRFTDHFGEISTFDVPETRRTSRSRARRWCRSRRWWGPRASASTSRSSSPAARSWLVYDSGSWSPFPPRRARPGPGPHSSPAARSWLVYDLVAPTALEQWLQRHPEAGSSWPSWRKASHSPSSDVAPPRPSSPVISSSGLPYAAQTPDTRCSCIITDLAAILCAVMSHARTHGCSNV